MAAVVDKVGWLDRSMRALRPCAARYQGHDRIFSPYALGLNRDGEHVVRVYQYGGSSSAEDDMAAHPDWRVYRVADLEGLAPAPGPWREPPATAGFHGRGIEQLIGRVRNLRYEPGLHNPDAPAPRPRSQARPLCRAKPIVAGQPPRPRRRRRRRPALVKLWVWVDMCCPAVDVEDLICVALVDQHHARSLPAQYRRRYTRRPRKGAGDGTRTAVVCAASCHQPADPYTDLYTTSGV